MPVCRRCSVSFEGQYRMKYCGLDCQFDANAKLVEGLTDEDCWEWNGARQRAGYGAFNNGKMIFSAHRYAAKRAFGDFDASLFVCHKCDNPSCINPAHLFLGTHQDNAADMGSKGRAAWAKRPFPKEIGIKIGNANRGKRLSEVHRKAIATALSAKGKALAKVEAAKKLLVSDSSLSISEIAKSVGYSGHESLSIAFNKFEGVSTSKWRKANIGNICPLTF